MRRSSGSGYDYPDPMNLAPVTPTASTASYPPAHPAPSPYYPPYEGQSPAHTVSSYPPIQASPPPISGTSSSVPPRSGMNVRDMLNPGDQGGGRRTSTDSDMLNALNRRGLSQ